MKRHSKITLALAILLCAALLLSGCGKKGLNIVGKWDSKELMEMNPLSSVVALGLEAPKEQWIEFTKDGKMEFMADGKTLAEYLKAAEGLLGDNAELKAGFEAMLGNLPVFTYKINGDKVDLNIGGQVQSLTAKMDGANLTLTGPDGDTAVFTPHK